VSATSAAAAPRYSELRVIGQLFAGYIALEGPGGMLLIDQHAAHERVTFERLRQQARAGAVQVQSMLTPALIELSPALAARADSSLDAMRTLGFEVEMFGPASLRVSGAPAVFGADSGAKLLEDLIGAIGEHGFDLSGADAFDDCLKTLACHGSIRVGRVLRGAEIAQLLADLDATEFKTNCPHGRPVHIELGRGAIERMFRR